MVGREKLTLLLLDFNETAGFRVELYAASGWLAVNLPIFKGCVCTKKKKVSKKFG